MVRVVTSARKQIREPEDAPIAAIDIGTNSVHMIVAEREGRGYRVLDREKEMVQLGAGVSRDGLLAQEAIDRTVTALARMAEIAHSFQVSRIVAFATSATREAENKEELLFRARREAGIEIGVISGEEEADLIYQAVRGAVELEEKTVLIIDIGGGSVELVTGTSDELFFAASLPIGALRLTERFFSKDPPGTRELARCRKFIRRKLRKPIAAIVQTGFDVAVGTSGTIQTLAKVASTGSGSVAGALEDLSRSDLDDLIEKMSNMTNEERSEKYDLDPRRSRVIVAGALVLEHMMHETRIKTLQSCSAALREGMIARILTLSGQDDEPGIGVRRTAVLDLAEKSRVDIAHAEHVARLALSIFDQTREVHRLDDDQRELLEYAALLHDAGQHVSFRAHHKHAYYLIRHSGLDGFDQKQILVIANVARYHRKAKPRPSHDNFSELEAEEREIVKRLSAILRFAEGLDRGRRGAVDEIRMDLDGTKLNATLVSSVPPTIELDSAESSAKYFARLFDLRVRFAIERS